MMTESAASMRGGSLPLCRTAVDDGVVVPRQSRSGTQIDTVLGHRGMRGVGVLST